MTEPKACTLEDVDRNSVLLPSVCVSRAADASGISRQHAHRLIDRYLLRQGGAAGDGGGRPRTAPGEKDDE